MKRIVIIGGGIAGLSAGVFAQKNGFASIILEKNPVMGGECTGWNRHGYHIDGCIHWLVGTKEGTSVNDLWKTVGALDGVEVYHPESFLVFEHNGQRVHLYRDLDRLRSSWTRMSPTDESAIREFCNTIEKLQSFEVPVGKPQDLMSLFERVRFMLSMRDVGMVMHKYSKVSLKDYAQNFRHPALREALASFLPEGYSALSVFFALASFTSDQASIPCGGSKALAMRMQARYLSLGGTIEPLSEVAGIVHDNRKVHHVICKDGREFEADHFIAACDPHVLYKSLLKGEYTDNDFEIRYNDPQAYPLASNVYVAVGYEGSTDDLPRTLRFPILPFEINQQPIDLLTITNYHYEPSFAPQGHTLITCAINQFHSDYDAWDSLARDPVAYAKEKERIGNAVMEAMITRFPQMRGKLKLLDVATPKTYERYCNAYRGAFMSFLPTTRGKMMAHTGRIKGLNNIFLSGQWLQPPGGLPVALITGRDTIMRICKQEKQPFKDQ
jgi:phytoene dehydrogenase-like protein